MQQILVAGYQNYLHDTDTEYCNLNGGGGSWHASGAERTQLISTDGVIKNWRIKLRDFPAGNPISPGAGKSFTFTFYLNGAPTAFTITISNAETSGENEIIEIDVTGGDYVYVECNPANSPTAVAYAWYSTIFEGDNPNESLIMGGATQQQSAADTQYYVPQGFENQRGPSENNHRTVIPTYGTFKDLYVMLSADPGTNPDAYTITPRLNGASPGGGLVVTIIADNTTGNDLVNDIDVSPADIFGLMVEPVNTPSVGPLVSWGMTFVADIDGESILLGGNDSWIPNDATAWRSGLVGSANGYSTTETFMNVLAQACVVTKLYVLMDVAPGAGKDRDFYIYGSGATTVVARVSDAAVTGNSGGLTDTIGIDNYLAIEHRPTNSPTNSDGYTGFVMYLQPPVLGGAGAKSPILEILMAGDMV